LFAYSTISVIRKGLNEFLVFGKIRTWTQINARGCENEQKQNDGRGYEARGFAIVRFQSGRPRLAVHNSVTPEMVWEATLDWMACLRNPQLVKGMSWRYAK
jgi:hypothetical protein